jgi:hypothetical protein
MTNQIHLSDDDLDRIAERMSEIVEDRIEKHNFCKFKTEELESLRSFAHWWSANGDIVRNFIKFWDRTRGTWWGIVWSSFAGVALYLLYLIIEHFGTVILPRVK